MGNYVISSGPRIAEIVPRDTRPAVFLADKRLPEYMGVRRCRSWCILHTSSVLSYSSLDERWMCYAPTTMPLGQVCLVEI